MRHIRIPRFVLLCGLGSDQPEKGTWCAKSGIRLTGLGDFGAPFGRARAIFLYLADKSAESGRMVRGTLDEIGAMFGVQGKWRSENLDRHFQRVADCAYHQLGTACEHCRNPHRSARTLDVIRRVHYCRDSGAFEVELGDELLADTGDSFTCPLHLIKPLIQAGQLQALDLLLWYHWELSRIDEADGKHRRAERGERGNRSAKIDPFGPDGPFGVAAIAEAGTKQRERLDKAHTEVVAVWKECPFRIIGRGQTTAIVYAPNHPHGRMSTISKCPNRRLENPSVARIQHRPSAIPPLLERLRKRLDDLQRATTPTRTRGGCGSRAPPR